MGLKYSSFAIRGIDVSQFNGTIDWANVNEKFAILRVGYGDTIDTKFNLNIVEALKTKIDLAYYWYSDYYSNWYNKYHPAYKAKLTDEQWGRKQANNCYAWIKPYGIKTVWLDVENTTVEGFPALTDLKANEHAQNINRAFIARMKELGIKVGIYASVGWCTWFLPEFKSLPFWGAWYNENQTVNSFTKYCRGLGWTGKLVVWQITSEEEIPGIGKCDGNGFIGTEQDYKELFGGEISNTPDDETEVIPVANTRTIEVKTVIGQYGVTLRKKPEVNILTKIKLLPVGTKLDCLEKVTDSKGNTWQRVGLDQYVADVYDGTQYLK